MVILNENLFAILILLIITDSSGYIKSSNNSFDNSRENKFDILCIRLL